MGIPNAMFDDTGGLQIAAARARRARRALLPVSRPEVGSSKNWPRPDLSMMEKWCSEGLLYTVPFKEWIYDYMDRHGGFLK